jgi:hypothetical protein
VVALFASCHALIHNFRIVSGVELGRALIDGSSRFAFGRAAGHDEGQGCQSSETSHLTRRADHRVMLHWRPDSSKSMGFPQCVLPSQLAAMAPPGLVR